MNQNIKEIFKKIVTLIPDKLWLSWLFKHRMGYSMDWKNPKTYSQKLQWLKVYDRNPIYTMLVDKYEVKPYIEERIGKQYIIPTLGVWNHFDDIDFDDLPDQFVLKCTHDSGGLVICKNKKEFDKEKFREIFRLALKRNPYDVTREWPYKNVKPRIIAEKYMEDETSHDLRDYKFFAFNGTMKAMFIATERNSREETKFDFFDRDFNHLNIRNGHPNAEHLPEKPTKYAEMCQLAEKLSEGLSQVRVDFYEVNGQVYFGEMTFFHWSGLKPFEPEKWDRVFGDWIILPEKAELE